jgi:hypothetical protein
MRYALIAAAKFRGTPAEFTATYGADVARRATYTAVEINWSTVYRYTVHVDRCAAHEKLNRSDNSVRLVVRIES